MSRPPRHPVYVVRDRDGEGCGHQHRTLEAGMNCQSHLQDLDRRWGPTGTIRNVWRVDRTATGARERVVA